MHSYGNAIESIKVVTANAPVPRWFIMSLCMI
jgi:hypothetical protein